MSLCTALLLWKLALSITTVFHAFTSGSNSFCIQRRKIFVFVVHSNRKGAITLSHFTPAIMVVLLYLYPYCFEGRGCPIGDQLLFFMSLWSIPLSSAYIIVPFPWVETIRSMFAINSILFPSSRSLYTTSFFYNCIWENEDAWE
jgi:hypothetical protein